MYSGSSTGRGGRKGGGGRGRNRPMSRVGYIEGPARALDTRHLGTLGCLLPQLVASFRCWLIPLFPCAGRYPNSIVTRCTCMGCVCVFFFLLSGGAEAAKEADPAQDQEGCHIPEATPCLCRESLVFFFVCFVAHLSYILVSNVGVFVGMYYISKSRRYACFFLCFFFVRHKAEEKGRT